MLKISQRLKIVDAESGIEIGEQEIREKTEKFCEILSKSSNSLRNDVVFIDIPRSFDTIFAIISCIQLRLAFTFCQQNEKFQNFRTTLIFDGQKVRRLSENTEEIDGICYVITTSGTTGEKKQVAVPFECIFRNIQHFISVFSLTSSDSVLFSTSLLFDPSIVELFMAFQTGCRLILTPDNFRSEPHLMQKTIEKYRPTIGQFTPTVVEMFQSLEKILSNQGPFRILLLGGSHFPLQLIQMARSSDCSTRIFNVYGVTEVSCWASIFEVERDCEEVFIGHPIDGTILEVTEDKELVLGGSRQCYVNGKVTEKHSTGDRVEQSKNGIRIVGRMDRIVKHRGVRICLDHLSSLALQENSDLRAVHFVHYKNQKLIQFTVGPGPSSQSPKSFRIDESTVVLITVVYVPQMPINSSGKVNERELLRIWEHQLTQEVSKNFLEILEEKLRFPVNLDKTFVELGIKSLLAAELCMHFEEKDEGDVLKTMLDGQTTVKQFLKMFETENLKCLKLEKSEKPAKEKMIKLVKHRQPRMKWAVDMKKCIDGNILIVNSSLGVCASHAGIVIAFNPTTGPILWRTECPKGTRFEATPTLVKEQIVIGDKINGLFFFSLSTGDMLSSLQYDNDPSIGIRSRVSYDGRFIYCTSENGTFHAIDPKTRLSIFDVRLVREGGGTSVGPVISPDRSILAVTTSGTVTRITVPNETSTKFEVSWSSQFGPIFAEPVFIDNNRVLILNVHGVLRVVNVENSHVTERIALHGEQCFCAPLISFSGNSLIVATQSGKLISLTLTPKLEVSHIFTFDLPGISFVKPPTCIERRILMVMSRSGWIVFVKMNSEDVEETGVTMKLSNKEVFTSPEFLNASKILLVPGRDDYLRAWKFAPLNFFEY